MYLDSEKKKEIFEKYGKSATNTGSAESAIDLQLILYFLVKKSIAFFTRSDKEKMSYDEDRIN